MGLIKNFVDRIVTECDFLSRLLKHKIFKWRVKRRIMSLGFIPTLCPLCNDGWCEWSIVNPKTGNRIAVCNHCAFLFDADDTKRSLSADLNIVNELNFREDIDNAY